MEYVQWDARWDGPSVGSSDDSWDDPSDDSWDAGSVDWWDGSWVAGIPVLELGSVAMMVAGSDPVSGVRSAGVWAGAWDSPSVESWLE